MANFNRQTILMQKAKKNNIIVYKIVKNNISYKVYKKF